MSDVQVKSEEEAAEAAQPDATEEKTDRTIVTEHGSGENIKDDCSELTDNNVDNNEETCPRSFPRKLMDILSNEEHQDVISWLPHGFGFIIHKKKVFATEILPYHFKASKFTSFTRKLNRWGFNRAARGPETGAYYHKLFVRDKPELVFQMTSNSGNKYSSAPQQHLLPAVMMGGAVAPGGSGANNAGNANATAMPFYMQPPPQMAMLSPQQQQALWQQQMQMFQFQQMQMMRYQQQHGGPPPPPMMMMAMSQPPPSSSSHAPTHGMAQPHDESEGASLHHITHDPLTTGPSEDGTGGAANSLAPDEEHNPLDDLGGSGIIDV